MKKKDTKKVNEENKKEKIKKVKEKKVKTKKEKKVKDSTKKKTNLKINKKLLISIGSVVGAGVIATAIAVPLVLTKADAPIYSDDKLKTTFTRPWGIQIGEEKITFNDNYGVEVIRPFKDSDPKAIALTATRDKTGIHMNNIYPSTYKGTLATKYERKLKDEAADNFIKSHLSQLADGEHMLAFITPSAVENVSSDFKVDGGLYQNHPTELVFGIRIDTNPNPNH